SSTMRQTMMVRRNAMDTLRNAAFGSTDIRIAMSAKQVRNVKALARMTHTACTAMKTASSPNVPFSDNTTPGNRKEETALTSRANTEASSTMAQRLAKKTVREGSGKGARLS